MYADVDQGHHMIEIVLHLVHDPPQDDHHLPDLEVLEVGARDPEVLVVTIASRVDQIQEIGEDAHRPLFTLTGLRGGHLNASRDDRASVRSPYPKERSPAPPRNAQNARDSARSTPRERSPARAPNRDGARSSPVPRSPPTGPAAFRPPTGPGGSRQSIAPSRAPSVSSNTTPAPVSAPSKPESSGTLAPPSGPRGYNPSARGSSRGGRGGFSDRGFSDRRVESTSAWGGAPSSRPAPSPSPTISPSPTVSNGIPTGPRASTPHTSTRPIPSRPAVTVTSTSRSQRFDAGAGAVMPANARVHPALASIAPLIPGGKLDPAYAGIPADLAARIKKNDEDAEKLRADLRQKQDQLRHGLRTWDRLERESAAMGLRSELSERQVRMLAGEGVGGAAF
ncbi:MAG: hypothetical protein M1818_003940 [Claussenomyces sp. TS43310]|nr:MAG: hypothetical protein M1818_003940 [Claussenomyces sp. TS43310]